MFIWIETALFPIIWLRLLEKEHFTFEMEYYTKYSWKYYVVMSVVAFKSAYQHKKCWRNVTPCLYPSPPFRKNKVSQGEHNDIFCFLILFVVKMKWNWTYFTELNCCIPWIAMLLVILRFYRPELFCRVKYSENLRTAKIFFIYFTHIYVLKRSLVIRVLT